MVVKTPTIPILNEVSFIVSFITTKVLWYWWILSVSLGWCSPVHYSSWWTLIHWIPKISTASYVRVTLIKKKLIHVSEVMKVLDHCGGCKQAVEPQSEAQTWACSCKMLVIIRYVPESFVVWEDVDVELLALCAKTNGMRGRANTTWGGVNMSSMVNADSKLGAVLSSGCSERT